MTLAALIVGLIGCGSGASSDDRASGSAEARRSVDVEITTDEARGVTAVIDHTGGTVQAVSGDGREYNLTIPPGALVAPVEITMTPVLSASGPFAERSIHAVQFAPDGLEFDLDATLTMTTSVPVDLQAFTWVAAGDDVRATPAFSDGTVLTQPIAHFSGAGWSEVGVLPVASEPGPQPLPAKPNYQAMHDDGLEWFNWAMGETAQQQLQGHDRESYDSAVGTFVLWYDHLIDGMLRFAEKDPRGAENALRNFTQWITRAQILDIDGHAKIADRIVKGKERARKALLNLLDDSSARCVDNRDLNQIARMNRVAAWKELMAPEEPGLQEPVIVDRIARCATFTVSLALNSKLSMGEAFQLTDRGVGTGTASMSKDFKIQGSGSAVVTGVGYDRGFEAFELLAQGLGALAGQDIANDVNQNDYVKCAADPGELGAQLTMSGVNVLKPKDVSGLELSLVPAVSKEIVLHCPGEFGDPAVGILSVDMVPMLFPELANDSGGTVPIRGFKGTLQKATASVSARANEEGMELTQRWDVTIEHAPQPAPARPTK